VSVGVVPFDPATLGTDVNLAMADLAGVWGLVSGFVNVGNAWVRRLSCPPGGLIYDPDYGHDVLGNLNASLTAADVAAEQGKISAEIEKDERCDTCRAAVILDRATEALYIVLIGKLVTGQPFQFVIAAKDLNIFLLAVNGIQVAGDTAIGQAAAAAGAPVQLVVGPPGPKGDTGERGPAGASGTPQLTLDFDEGSGADDSGAEVVVYQRLVNFDALPATVTFELVGNVYSQSGTAFIRMSYGGTSRAADGTQVGADITTGSSTPVPLSTGATISNPGGQLLVKVTVESSGAGVEAGIQDRTLTVR
jgi:hypothetical protein